MKIRLLLLSLILLLAPIGVFAQAECPGLSQADCQIIADASLKSGEATSYNMDFTMRFSLQGMSAIDPEVGDVMFSASGSGSVAKGAGIESEINIGFATDMMWVSDSGESSLEGVPFFIVDDAIFSRNDDGVMEGIAIATLEEQIERGEREAPFDFLNVIPSAPKYGVYGQLAQIPRYLGYIGGDAAELFGSNLSSITDLAEFIPVEQLFSAVVGDATALADLSEAEAFISYTRNPDTDGMSYFTFNADVAEYVVEQFSKGEGSDSPMAGIMTFLSDAMVSELNIDQWIGTEDGYVHRVNVTFDTTVDIGLFTGIDDMEPLTITLDFTVNIYDYNNGDPVIVPDDAVMIDG